MICFATWMVVIVVTSLKGIVAFSETQGLCQVGQEPDPDHEGKFRWIKDPLCPGTGSDCNHYFLGGVNVEVPSNRQVLTECQDNDAGTLSKTSTDNSYVATTVPNKSVTSAQSGTQLATNGVIFPQSHETGGSSVTNSFTLSSAIAIPTKKGVTLALSGTLVTTSRTPSQNGEMNNQPTHKNTTSGNISVTNKLTSFPNATPASATPNGPIRAVEGSTSTVQNVSMIVKGATSTAEDLTLGHRSLSASAKPTTTANLTSTLVSISIPVFLDCTEARNNGYTTSGVYKLSLSGTVTSYWCDMDTDGGGWMVLQRRQDGSIDFQRNWNEYESGFGDVNGEFWLGNVHIRNITAEYNFELRIDLYDWDSNSVYALYRDFKVTGNTYVLNITGYDGLAGDSLSYGNLKPFSTIDMDNDESINNCMELYGGGWWASRCFDCNLNGPYRHTPDLPNSKGIVWEGWKGINYALKRSEMKMRKIGL